ncbi:MAG: hypothetical protein IT450_15590 [Phycisphaerales bacterium]|nr:hypothetical protein [Phycisphaerales bacterium]
MRSWMIGLFATVALGTAQAGIVSTGWYHEVSHGLSAGLPPDDVPNSGGIYPNSTLTLLDLTPPDSMSSTLFGSESMAAHSFSIGINIGEPGSSAAAESWYWFEVDQPMSFEVSGGMSGLGGDVEFSWSLTSLDINDDVLALLGGDDFVSGAIDSLDAFSFTATQTTGTLLPGFRYLFRSNVSLDAFTASADGDIQLLVSAVPAPESALMAVIGLAMIGGRRWLGRAG